MPTDFKPPERSGLLSEKPSYLIITPQKLVPLAIFEEFSRGDLCALDKGNAVFLRTASRSGSFQVGKRRRGYVLCNVKF